MPMHHLEKSSLTVRTERSATEVVIQTLTVPDMRTLLPSFQEVKIPAHLKRSIRLPHSYPEQSSMKVMNDWNKWNMLCSSSHVCRQVLLPETPTHPA